MKYIVWSAVCAGMILSCADPGRDYVQLHRSALVADTHSDTPLRMVRGFDISERDTTGHMDIPRLQEGGVDLQVFACFVYTETPPEECRPTIDELIDTLEAQIQRNPDRIAVCTTASQAEEIVAGDRIAAFIGIENGVAINNSLDNLQHFYDRGVRYLTLTHTASNDWCISSADTMPAFDGLTDFGHEVVRQMNELGMIVDISHASVAAVREVLEVTEDPVIASHSCVYSICPHDRNLTDEQIMAVAENGGLICLNFFNGYLAPDNRWFQISDSFFNVHRAEIDSTVALYEDDREARHEALEPFFRMRSEAIANLGIDVGTLVDHVDHIVNLVGPDHVGFGSDFDGVGSLPNGLTDCSMVPAITRELVARGYSDVDIGKILGGNFMRVFREVCGG
ncbi:MAG: dipeptidase [Candidatus Zixiibacteriota bacterium]|nr:MAG: dipeptidase [candidate division Zixibacteria bacterium]